MFLFLATQIVRKACKDQLLVVRTQKLARFRQQEEEKKEETTTTDVPKENPDNKTTPPDETVVKPRGDYAFANPVPGKEGFVFSPYNQKLVDVRDIPSGTLVQDPTYTASEKKYFRVP